MLPKESPGVPLVELRAALDRTRFDDVAGEEWSPATWARVWSILTPLQQRVVYWHLFDALTFSAIAEQLGTGRGAVDGHWRRALVRIRAAIEP